MMSTAVNSTEPKLPERPVYPSGPSAKEPAMPKEKWPDFAKQLNDAGIQKANLTKEGVWHLKPIPLMLLQFKMKPEPMKLSAFQKLFKHYFEKRYWQQQTEKASALANQLQSKVGNLGLVRVMLSSPQDHCCGNKCFTCGNQGNLWSVLG